MPDSPDPDKTILGIRLERTLKRRVERAARQSGKSVSDFVRSIIADATAGVTLTSADYEQIARETRLAEERSNHPRRSH